MQHGKIQIRPLAAVVVLVGLLLGCTQAEPLPQDGTQPTGLLLFQVSAPFTGKLIFQTLNATIIGNTGGISGADGLCNSDLNRPNSSTYKALLSDASGVGSRIACMTTNCTTGGATENFDWVLKANTSYYRADGITHLFTTNASGIFVFGTMSNTFSDGGLLFWTGLNTDWLGNVNICADWTAGGNGQVGADNVTSSAAISNASVACGTNLTLLCVEQ